MAMIICGCLVRPATQSYQHHHPPELWEVDGLMDGLEDDGIAKNGTHSRVRRNIIHEDRKWPNATIPYKLTAYFNIWERKKMSKAMNILEQNTCLKFVPHSDEHEVMNEIIRPERLSCASGVGVNPASSPCPVYLHADCFHTPVLLHEWLHSIGFWHEHTRPDRDQYLEFIEENVTPEAWNGVLRKIDDSRTMDSPYDYCSNTHYGLNAGSINGKNTMVPRKPINNREENFGLYDMTEVDIQKINTLYNCEGYPQIKRPGIQLRFDTYPYAGQFAFCLAISLFTRQF